ncbi:MAG: hypothetical protein JETT_2615 [Candidatus Jettenia ecosi]|uniref:Uncharacterized protein n=1 Tax=Candidatus Jettenia ecosi TaxID=2494326 RepID=A0A533Q8T3_9BACT|nr:MAG: hypothetical protein JETT_2615 [Candidatus Jettenia ecosi]
MGSGCKPEPAGAAWCFYVKVTYRSDEAKVLNITCFYKHFTLMGLFFKKLQGYGLKRLRSYELWYILVYNLMKWRRISKRFCSGKARLATTRFSLRCESRQRPHET